jgi:hypothetical protein
MNIALTLHQKEEHCGCDVRSGCSDPKLNLEVGLYQKRSFLRQMTASQEISRVKAREVSQN